MSTYQSVDDVIKEIEHWLRLSTLLHSGIKESLLSVLHNDQNDLYIGLPRDPVNLYNGLNTTHKKKLTELRNNKVISREQWVKLFTKTGKTYSENLDITLITVLIINCTTLQPPHTGWNHRLLLPTDNSKSANVLRAREWRNYVHHTDPNDIDLNKFVNKWTEGENIIKYLGYIFNTQQLKKVSLDPKCTNRQQLILQVLHHFCQLEVKQHSNAIKLMQNTIAVNVNKITDLEKEITAHQTKLDDHVVKLQTHKTKFDDLNVELQTHQTKLDDHDSKLKNYQAMFDNQEGELKIQKLEINMLKSHITHDQKESSISQITKDTENNQVSTKEREQKIALRSMEAISYIAYGCIFKIQVLKDYKIQSVKIKCVSAKDGSDWMDVNQSDDEGCKDGDTVCYEVKNLDEETMLLKIENLQEQKKYRIQLQTNDCLYTEEVTIYGHKSCTHVTNMDDVFIVLTPPLGQFNDPQNCRQGLQGYFIEESLELMTYISEGAAVKSMTVKQFSEFSNVYCIRNFSSSEKVLQFLPLYMITDQVIKKVADLFVQLLSTRTEFRAILTNLNSNEYFQCCPNTYDILQTDLPYHNRILVFDQETTSILNIRVLQQKSTNGDIHKEMEHCITDMQYFVAANRHHSCSCYLIGILCFWNLTREEVRASLSYYFSKNSKSLVNLFYLSKDDLKDVRSLQQWWADLFEKKLKSIYLCKENFDSESFRCICSQSMATVALAKFSVKLPTFLPDPYLQITSLLLNQEQLAAIESSSNRKLIVGSFGTGKSIVLDEIAKKKFHECLHTDKPTLLLYVVWEPYSLLETQKKLFLETLAKIEANYSRCLTLMAGNMHSLWEKIGKGGSVSLLKFLRYYLLKRSSYHVVHILIDELPTNAVHFEELGKLKSLLEYNFESSVNIATQSITINRTTTTDSAVKYDHDRDCLDQLGMDRFVLVKVMRNSKQVTALLKASQDKIRGAETVLRIYNSSSTNAGVLQRVKAHVIAKTKKFFLQEFDVENQISQAEKFDQEELSSNQNLSSSSQLQESASTVPPIEPEKISRIFDAERNQRRPSSYLTTTFQFHELETGNEVTDQKPTLVHLPPEVDFKSELSSKILTCTLKELCLKEEASTLMLCSSMEEIQQVSYCLSLIPNFKFVTYIPQLQGVFPSDKERLSIFSAFNNGSCLLTDDSGIKGIEAKRVIIFTHYHEYFLRHLLIETVARANVWAYILLHTPTPPIIKGDRQTLGDMLEELGAQGLLHVEQVTLYEDHLNFNKPFCRDGRMFKVNKICPFKLQGKQTLDDYRTSFQLKFPIKRTPQSYRTAFTDLASLHEYEHQSPASIDYEVSAKVLLMGGHCVGKTCLVNRICHDTFVSTSATLSPNHTPKTFDYRNAKFKFGFWDNSGLQNYRSLHRLYYRNTNAVIIVYDVTNEESFEEVVSYWIDEVKNNPTIRQPFVLLVGTRKDLFQQRSVAKSEVQDVANAEKIMFFEVSAKTGENVNLIREWLCEQFLYP